MSGVGGPVEGRAWGEMAAEAPELAAAVEARLRAAKHHVLATLRADGSPRVSGTEVQLVDSELYLGCMGGSRKALDLRRDGRLALHANPGDGSMDGGDAKLSGVAVELTDPAELAAYLGDLEQAPPPGELHAFRVRLTEVVLTTIHPDGDRLVIASWHPGRGREVRDRA